MKHYCIQLAGRTAEVIMLADGHHNDGVHFSLFVNGPDRSTIVVGEFSPEHVIGWWLLA